LTNIEAHNSLAASDHHSLHTRCTKMDREQENTATGDDAQAKGVFGRLFGPKKKVVAAKMGEPLQMYYNEEVTLAQLPPDRPFNSTDSWVVAHPFPRHSLIIPFALMSLHCS
jgi:hypothetical protein